MSTTTMTTTTAVTDSGPFRKGPHIEPPFGVAPPFEISLNGGAQIRLIRRQLT
jgi:hypothetical protein